MALQTATNPTTGERFALVNGQWVPFSQSATNQKTGEKFVLVNNQWVGSSGTPEEQKEYAGFTGSFLEAIQQAKQTPEAIAYAKDPSDENRRAFLKAAESKYRSTKGFSLDEGENWETFKQLLGSSLGFLVAPAAAGLAASTTAGLVSGPAAAVAAPVAGATASRATLLGQYEIEQLQRVAQEQERAIAEGRKPPELDLAKVTAAASGEAALDVYGFNRFKNAIKAFPLFRNLVSADKEVAKDAAQVLIDAYRNGTLKSTGRGIVEGIGKGIAFEVPQELAQTGLERWGANLSLTDKEAVGEYIQTAIGAAALGGPLGALEGGIGTRKKGQLAKALEEKDYKEQIEQLAGSPGADQAGLPADVIEGRRPLVPLEQREPEVPAEKASVAQRDEPRNLKPAQVEGEIKSMEQAQERRANMLSDLDQLKEDFAAAGIDFDEGVSRIREAFDSTATRLDIFRKHLSSLTEPAAETQTAPVAPIPQTAVAQQTLIDEPLAKSLGLKEGPDTGQPVVITSPQTVTAQVEPTTPVQQVTAPVSAETVTAQPATPAAGVEIQPTVGAVPQNAAAQQALPVPVSETVADPLFEPAANAVIRAAENGRPINISTLQQALGVGYDRARTLMDRLQIEGVVTRPDKAGNRSIVSSQVQGAVNEPTAAAETAPRVAEPVEPQPVGGGVEVPPSGLGPEGRVAEVPPSEGMERPVRTAADVVGGEGAVSPALEAVPAAEPVTPAKPSTISDLAEQYARGEITLDELSRRISEMGEPSTAKEEAAPPVENTEAESAENIAANIQMVQQQEMGSTETVVPITPPPSVPKQVSAIRSYVEDTLNKFDSFQELTSDRVNSILDWLSALPDNAREGVYALWSLHDQVQLFRNKLPSLRALNNVINARASSRIARMREIGNNIAKWSKVLSKNRKYVKDFYRIAHESTRLQIDFNDKTDTRKEALELTREFEALPEDVRDVYWEMLTSYRKLSSEYLKFVENNLSPTAANEIRKLIEKNRLKIYLPLFREGDYWLRYQDANNETVVRAFKSPREREREWKEAEKLGATGKQEYANIDDFFSKGGAGPFFTEVMKELDAQNAPAGVKRAIYELYLDQLPASSVRQLHRKRNGYKGYESDLINVYSNVATRMASQLNNLQFTNDINAARKAVVEEASQYAGEAKNLAIPKLIKDLDARLKDLQTPDDYGFISKIANSATSVSYWWYILGNVSTATVNMVQLGTVVYPMLGAKYGPAEAGDAMEQALRQYSRGGWDKDGRENVSVFDWTFGANPNLDANHKKLFETALQQNAISVSTGYEITEGKKKRLRKGDYVGIKARTERILGWLFQNTERFNREITLLATFDLELKKNGGDVNKAIQTAIDLTADAHGSTVNDAAPRIFQNNIGRALLVFKKFGVAQISLISRLMHQVLKGESREVQAVAAKQVLGIMSMSFLFAGVAGMPFYSFCTTLAGLFEKFFGDEDDPVNPDQRVRETVGLLPYRGPFSVMLNTDWSGRTGFGNLLWKDDDKRQEEIGPVLFAVEQLLGAPYAIAMNWQRAYKDWNEGHRYRALEEALPAVIRNAMKAARYYEDGAKTRQGEKIVDNFSAYNVMMQGIGFSPLEVAEKGKAAGAIAYQKAQINQRRKVIFDKLWIAYQTGDKRLMQEALADKERFNKSEAVQKAKKIIKPEDVLSSRTKRQKMLRESVYGIQVPMKERGAYKQFMIKEYEKEED